MNKKTFLTAAVLCSITLTGAFAQEPVKINESSAKGFYLRLGGGYSIGMEKTSGCANGLMPAYNTNTVNNTEYQSRFGTVNLDEKSNTTTKTNAKFSLGEGINMNLGIGYMFNKYIGAEINVNYFLGIENTIETVNSTKSYRDVSVSSNNSATHTVTENSNLSSTTYGMKRSGISVTPAIKLTAPVNDRLSIYSRIGVVVPVSEKMTYEYNKNSSSYYSNKVNNSGTSTRSGSNENKIMEFTPYFSLGYAAALGINFTLSSKTSLFVEVNTVVASFEAKKSTITQWTESSYSSNSNSTNKNLLDGLKTYDKETEYLKEYIVDNTSTTTGGDSPRKDVSFSLPASSIGMTAGLAFRF